MAFVLILCPILLLGVLAIRWVRNALFVGDLRRNQPFDPTPDLTELLRLRESGEMDQETFERLRDRFASRRSGPTSGIGFEPVLREEVAEAEQSDDF